MSENVINWADMHKFATTALEGEFPVVIVQADAVKTADQSKDMIKYKAKIESGPFVDRPITGQFVISPDSPTAMRILFGHLAVLGVGADFFSKNPNAPIAQIAQALVGRRAIAVVGQRDWNGRTFDEIKEWKPTLGGPGGSGAGLGGVLGGNVGGPLGGLNVGPGSPTTTPASTSSVPSPAGSPAPFAPASPIAEQPSTAPPERPF